MGVLRLFLVSLGLCFFSCGKSRQDSPAPLPKNPQRLVTFTPSLTEIVFALGAGDRVLGTTDWCHYPEEAKKKEKLGGLGNPNYERILELRPELFLIMASQKAIADKVESLGIPVLRVPCETLQDADLAVERVGDALGKLKEARALRQSIQDKLQEIQRKISGSPRPKVLLVLERQPGTVMDISIVGSKNVMDSLIEQAGGQNVFADCPLSYPKASKEEILSRNPEILLDFSVHGYSPQGDDAKELEAWKGLPTLKAVRDGKVFIMPQGFDLYPGPRIPQIVEAFAKIFHPDRFR